MSNQATTLPATEQNHPRITSRQRQHTLPLNLYNRAPLKRQTEVLETHHPIPHTNHKPSRATSAPDSGKCC
ncbi:hypothetical protein PCASD_25662 [Puccinia coronata f. sp. avenae]|uniref:Uncharacterized protein n=1 Tax=Puccinia coronata f. sp. avenae TaxID=200324 RepID=A0A2N5RXA8_9BASI|nr:hypothetical protein PCASD_25662 [Puccinia coronata f. sp. avenae]